MPTSARPPPAVQKLGITDIAGTRITQSSQEDPLAEIET